MSHCKEKQRKKEAQHGPALITGNWHRAETELISTPGFCKGVSLHSIRPKGRRRLAAGGWTQGHPAAWQLGSLHHLGPQHQLCHGNSAAGR